ncbi:hypothetical protein QM012_002597 [Aureobasidium pullulans]|uniref:Uncharacterized protein n=1 Tax=Aureobasidium pullulans TaxID=5580 RepID=A0ABR0TBH5_AURPU
MANDLQSILARHNLRGINVANFSASSQRPTPQQHQPYQYPAPIPQRAQYSWSPATGQSAVPQPALRPSFAWPAPPQPQYTIDPRHYSYNIWGKAPVYSLTGDDKEDDEAEGSGDDDEAEPDADVEAAVEADEDIETKKPAEDAVTDATATDAGDKDIPPVDAVEATPAPAGEERSPEMLAAEQPSDPPQKEASPAEPAASEPPVGDEIATESTETAPQESGPEVASESIASTSPEEKAHDSELTSPETVDGMKPNHQDSVESIEVADPVVEEIAASEEPAPAESVEIVKQEDDDSHSPSKSTQEEQADVSKPPEAEMQDSEKKETTVFEVPVSSDEPQPTNPAGEDLSPEDSSSHDIAENEQHYTKEHESTPEAVQSGGPTTSAEETDEAVPDEAPAASDDIQVTVPEASGEIPEVTGANDNGSTDDTAAIIVVDVDAPNVIEDTNVPPPPPPPAPRVTIAEPDKPAKTSKKKPSSKSSRSRHVEKLKERPLEIIPLREGKGRNIAKVKNKGKKVKSKTDKGSDVESVDLTPPPPPVMVVDVPPPAPSPPPSEHVIQVVETEDVQVVDEIGEVGGGENTVTPEPDVDGGEVVAVEQPQIDHVADEKEGSDHAGHADTTAQPAAEQKTPDVVQAAETADVAVPDQQEDNDLTPAANDSSCCPDADAPEAVEAEQTPEADAVEKKDNDAPAAMSSSSDIDVKSPSVEEGDHMKAEEGSVKAEKVAPHIPEETASDEPENESSSGDPAVDAPPQGQDLETNIPGDVELNTEEATKREAENLDEFQHDTAEGTPDDAPAAEFSTSQEDKSASPPSVAGEPVPPATEEPEGSSDASDPVTENDPASNDVLDDAVNMTTQEASAESAIVEESTPEASENMLTSKASEANPGDQSGTGGDVEASPSDSPAPADVVPEEDVAEPAPTLMELAALILPSGPDPQSTEDIVVTDEVLGAETIEADANALGTVVESGVCDPVSEAVNGEEGDSKGDAAVTDQENTVTAPPDAPMPPELATHETELESDRENKADGHEAPTQTNCDAVEEVQELEVATETAGPAETVTNDQESDQTNSKADHDHAMKAEDSDENKASVQTENVTLLDDNSNTQDEEAQSVQDIDIAKTKDRVSSDDADVHKADAQDSVSPAEAATESSESTPTTSEEQADGSDGPSDDATVIEVPLAAEQDTKDSPSPVVGGSVGDEAVEAEAGDASILQDLKEAPATEEKASPDPTEDGIVEGIGESVAEPASGATESPASIHGDAMEALKSAGVPQEDGAMAKTEAEEVTGQHVIDGPETQESAVAEPAGEDTEDVAAPENIADEGIQASETVVVEAADSAPSEEQCPKKPSEPALQADSSEQVLETEVDHIPEQLIITTEDTATTRSEVELETEAQDDPEEAQVAKDPEEVKESTPEDLPEPRETTEETEPVNTAPLLEGAPEPNEEPSPGQEPIPTLEEKAVDLLQPEDAVRESEDALDQPKPEEVAASSPSKHSSKVSFDEPSVSTKDKEPVSPSRERRKSSKSSSSNRHSSSRHKVKDVSRSPSDQKSSSAPISSRRHGSTITAPQPSLFRRISTTNSRSSRAEAAEQAEIRRRAAELAAREQEVHRQLERARKRAALEEQERLLREKEEELARIRAAEKEKKRARREEQKRREQEAREQERLARERAEEEARAKELERAERRKRRRESERSHHRDDRPRTQKHSSNREAEVRDVSPTAKPRVRRHKTEDIDSDRIRSRSEYDTREAPSSSRRPEEGRHHRSSHRDPEKTEKPKKSVWKSLLSKI